MKKKHIILEIKEFSEKMESLINETIKNGVPCYFLEKEIKDFYISIKKQADIEIDVLKQQEQEEAKNECDEKD